MTRIKLKCNSGNFLFRPLPIEIIWFMLKYSVIMLKSIWFRQIDPSKKFLNDIKIHQK